MHSVWGQEYQSEPSFLNASGHIRFINISMWVLSFPLTSTLALLLLSLPSGPVLASEAAFSNPQLAAHHSFLPQAEMGVLLSVYL